MTAASIEQVARSFGSLYRDTYGIDVDAPTELVNFRVRVVRQVEKLSLIARVGATGDAEQALIGHRAAWLDGSHGFVDCPVYEWEKLEPGSPLSGPAVVEGPDTTVVIPSTATVQVDPWENLVLRRRAAPAGADSGDSRLDR
jgi:N-methylhydantoinase A